MIRRIAVIALLLLAGLSVTALIGSYSLNGRESAHTLKIKRFSLTLGVLNGRVQLRFGYPSEVEYINPNRQPFGVPAAPQSSSHKWQWGPFFYRSTSYYDIDWKHFLFALPGWLAVALFLAYPLFVFFRVPWLRRRRRKNGQCIACGYDLRGNVSGQCPECGRKFLWHERGKQIRRGTNLIRGAAAGICVAFALAAVLFPESKAWRFSNQTIALARGPMGPHDHSRPHHVSLAKQQIGISISRGDAYNPPGFQPMERFSLSGLLSYRTDPLSTPPATWPVGFVTFSTHIYDSLVVNRFVLAFLFLIYPLIALARIPLRRWRPSHRRFCHICGHEIRDADDDACAACTAQIAA
jgi:predicted RNA-binding Zn-ribbon protein involved in translation (DUF1610 family)